jgi:hypothetical protein
MLELSPPLPILLLPRVGGLSALSTRAVPTSFTLTPVDICFWSCMKEIEWGKFNPGWPWEQPQSWDANGYSYFSGNWSWIDVACGLGSYQSILRFVSPRTEVMSSKKKIIHSLKCSNQAILPSGNVQFWGPISRWMLWIGKAYIYILHYWWPPCSAKKLLQFLKRFVWMADGLGITEWYIFNLWGGGEIVSLPITVTARSKAWTVFVRSNAGIVGSNPTRGMDVFVRSNAGIVGSNLTRGMDLFVCSNAGIVGSNPIRGMDVFVCPLLCIGLAKGWSLRPRKPTDCV